MVTLREISLTQQLQGSLHGFFRSRLPLSPVQAAVTLLGVPAMEHLNEVCDQTATCLMATSTPCMPENRAMSHAKQTSTMVDWEELNAKHPYSLACYIAFYNVIHQDFITVMQ